MKIKTVLFGEQDVDLTSHKKKKGLNNIVNSIIKELKTKSGKSRLSNQEKADLHVEIRNQLLK